MIMTEKPENKDNVMKIWSRTQTTRSNELVYRAEQVSRAKADSRSKVALTATEKGRTEGRRELSVYELKHQ